MTTFRRRLLFLLLIAPLAAVLVGCGQPPPATPATTGPPPPPPPAPTPEVKPAPPPKTEPDPYAIAMLEVGKILQRYGEVYADVRDEVSADKAVAEIGQLTARLRDLAKELAKIPHHPEQDKQTLVFQTELTRMQTAALTNQDMQRVLADPDLAIKFLTAHQSFLLEGVGAVGQAIVLRQPSVTQPAADQPAK